MSTGSRSAKTGMYNGSRRPTPGPELSKHLLKTKVCSLYLNGRCFYGDKCFYAHSVEELREQPDLSRTSLCPNWRKGKCSSGDDCRYAHNFRDMHHSAKGVMCLWYTNGHCTHGSKCRFAHSGEEARSFKQKKISFDELSTTMDDTSLLSFSLLDMLNCSICGYNSGNCICSVFAETTNELLRLF